MEASRFHVMEIISHIFGMFFFVDSRQEGETVEFSVVKDGNGRSKAENVTGPMGAYVRGAPRGPRTYPENNFGFGGGHGRGYGTGGRDGGM